MILLVDDNIGSIDGHIEELKLSGFDEVFYQPDVDLALRFFEEHHNRINLLILDVKMPTGDSFAQEEAQNGERTGILFFEKVRQITPQLPIIVLTIVSDEEISERFLSETNCWFFQKAEILPHELVERVREILSNSKPHEGGHNG